MERVAGVIERLTAQHAGGDIICVGHGGAIRAAIGHALSLEPEVALACQIDNCSVTRLDHFGPTDSHPAGAWALFHVNHLSTVDSALAPDHTAMLALLQR